MSVKTAGDLTVSKPLHDFIVNEALLGIPITADGFFESMSAIFSELSDENQNLLAKRDELQAKLDAWHKANPGAIDLAAYRAYLKEIGYLVPEVADFSVNVSRVDAEIAVTAGPQLVVPVNNARYALNAANARWGSLDDALYGTDAIAEDNGAQKSADRFNPIRGERVVAFANKLLDDSVPLASGSYSEIAAFAIEDANLQASLSSGEKVSLCDKAQCIGYRGVADAPTAILLSLIHI